MEEDSRGQYTKLAENAAGLNFLKLGRLCRQLFLDVSSIEDGPQYPLLVVAHNQSCLGVISLALQDSSASRTVP